MSFASVAAFRVTLVLALVFASLAIANAQASTVHPDTPIDRAERDQQVRDRLAHLLVSRDGGSVGAFSARSWQLSETVLLMAFACAQIRNRDAIRQAMSASPVEPQSRRPMPAPTLRPNAQALADSDPHLVAAILRRWLDNE
jgi:hypothetical protein